MTLPSLSRLFPWLLLVAAILLLAYCNNRGAKERQVLKERAAMSDSLRQAGDDDRALLAKQNWDYQQAMDIKALEVQKQAIRADSIQRIARGQTDEIRALYAELGKPWPVDTVEIASKCCEVAVKLADSFDSLQVADNLKDAAYMSQIDLSTYMVDTLNQALKRESARYDKLDSLNKRYQAGAKLKGSLWGGLRAAVGPVSSAGAYLKWATPGGKEYGVGGGRMGGGWYGEISVGTKFSFRRIR
jgi:hypothetical protein